MALDPRIILAGQQADIMGSFDRGQQAGERTNQIREQNALRGLYQEQGAGLLAGEQGAMNALAQINAPLAMDFRSSQQTLQINQENARLRAAELAASLDQTTRTRAGEQFTMGANMIATAQTPEQFQAVVSRPGFAESAGVLGITPEMLTFENRQMLAAAAMGAADAMKLGQTEAPVTKQMKLADGSEAMVQWNPQSRQWEPASIPEGGTGAQPREKLTESQAKTTLFQTLQTETQPVLQQIESIWDAANLPDAAARATPIAGNFFQSQQGQIYSAAAAAWAEGALRLATGAAATQPEIERTIKTYFAQPGDTPATIEFKRGMREMYTRAIDRSLGYSPEGTLVLPDAFAQQYMGQTPQPGGTQGNAGQSGNLDFSQMSAADLAQVDVNSLTPAQMEAMLQRFNEVSQ